MCSNEGMILLREVRLLQEGQQSIVAAIFGINTISKPGLEILGLDHQSSMLAHSFFTAVISLMQSLNPQVYSNQVAALQKRAEKRTSVDHQIVFGT